MPEKIRGCMNPLLIVGIALLVRVVGINFGLPHLYHADEPIVVNHALAYGMGDPNPHYFKLPPLVSYVLFFCFGLYYLAAYVFGYVSNTGDFQNLFLSDPSSFYLLGRLVLGAGLGALTVFILFCLVDRFFGRRVALGTSFLLAVNFLHVRDSHYIYLDIPLLLITTASFFPILTILERARMKDYVLFGFCLGLAVGTKYNGFFILIPFALAHVFANQKNFLRTLNLKLMAAALTSVATFLLTNPYALFDYATFTRDLFSMHEYEGRMGWSHHLFYSMNGALGTPVLAFGLAGILTGLWAREKKRLVMIFYLAGYYFVLTQFSEQHARYVLPLMPLMGFFAADMLDRLTAGLPKARMAYALGMMIAIPSMIKVYHCDRILTAEDVRTTALQWIEEQIPSGSKIALDSSFFMPRLKPTLAQLEEKQRDAWRMNASANKKRLAWMIANAKAAEVPRYELYFLNNEPDSEFLFSRPVVAFDVQKLKEYGVEYVVAARINQDLHPDFYSRLNQDSDRLKRFSPYRDPNRDWPISGRPLTGAPFLLAELASRKQNGQILEIYKLR